MKTLVSMTLLALLIPAIVLAQVPLPLSLDGDGLEQLLGVAWQALQMPGAARWVVLSLVGVLAAVASLRAIARKMKGGAFWAWVLTDEGGTVLKWFASSVTAVIVQALAGGMVVTWKTVAIAVGLGALASLRSDWRRLVRAVIPLVRLLPGIGASLATFLGWLAGAPAVAKQTAVTPTSSPSPGT